MFGAVAVDDGVEDAPLDAGPGGGFGLGLVDGVGAGASAFERGADAFEQAAPGGFGLGELEGLVAEGGGGLALGGRGFGRGGQSDGAEEEEALDFVAEAGDLVVAEEVEAWGGVGPGAGSEDVQGFEVVVEQAFDVEGVGAEAEQGEAEAGGVVEEAAGAFGVEAALGGVDAFAVGEVSESVEGGVAGGDAFDVEEAVDGFVVASAVFGGEGLGVEGPGDGFAAEGFDVAVDEGGGGGDEGQQDGGGDGQSDAVASDPAASAAGEVFTGVAEGAVFGEGLEVGGEGGGGGVASAGLRFEAGADDGGEGGRDFGEAVAEPRGVAAAFGGGGAEGLGHGPGAGSGAVGEGSGGHGFVEQDAEGVDVGAGVDAGGVTVGEGFQVFGGHVGEGAAKGLGCRFVGTSPGRAGEVEVEEHGAAVGGDQDVGGLDVAVDDAVLVGMVEGFGQACADPGDGVAEGQIGQGGRRAGVGLSGGVGRFKGFKDFEEIGT